MDVTLYAQSRDVIFRSGETVGMCVPEHVILGDVVREHFVQVNQLIPPTVLPGAYEHRFAYQPHRKFGAEWAEYIFPSLGHACIGITGIHHKLVTILCGVENAQQYTIQLGIKTIACSEVPYESSLELCVVLLIFLKGEFLCLFLTTCVI